MVMHNTTIFYSRSFDLLSSPWPFTALISRSYGRLNLSLSARAIRSAIDRSIGCLALSLSRSDSRRSMGGGGGDLGLDLYKRVSFGSTPMPFHTPHSSTPLDLDALHSRSQTTVARRHRQVSYRSDPPDHPVCAYLAPAPALGPSNRGHLAHPSDRTQEGQNLDRDRDRDRGDTNRRLWVEARVVRAEAPCRS